MPRCDDTWPPTSDAPNAVANSRVCLALLRVYRNVTLRTHDCDLSALARPFWPLLRRQRKLLLHATAGFSAPPDAEAITGVQPARRRRSSISNIQIWQQWHAEHKDGRGMLPALPPGTEFLEALGEAMLRGDSRFRLVFDAVQKQLQARVAVTRLPSDRAVNVLARMLSLAPEEKKLLALAAAVHACDFGTAPFTAVAGAARLLAGVRAALVTPTEHQVRHMLRRSSALSRSGLMDPDAFNNRRDMEDVLRLSGQGMLLLSSPATKAAELARLVLKPLDMPATVKPLAWPHLEQRTVLLETAVRRALSTHRNGVNILLYGEPGTGKTAYAHALVTRAGAHGYAVSDTMTGGEPASRDHRLASLMLTQVFAPPGRSVVVLDEAEDVFQSEYNNPFSRLLGKRDESKSWTNNLLEGNKHPVIWISNRIDHLDPAYLRRFTYCLEFPTSPRKVRSEVARQHLEPLQCSAQVLDAVAGNPRLAPAVVASAAGFAQLLGATGPRADAAVTLMLGDLTKALGAEQRPQVAQRATRFDMRYLNTRGAVSAQAVSAGLQRLGQGRVLLSGPPGTGKTQYAAEIAQQLGRELVYRTASDINSMWYGQSERNVARLFGDCDPRGEILFLDEADTLLSPREQSSHRAEVAVTAEFLRQLEAFTGVFVCATNFGKQLDAALLRRFEYRLELLPLTVTQRAALFCEAALGWGGAGTAPELPLAVQARLQRLDQLTPGDFANVVRRVRSLQLALDPDGWVGELEAEHATKPGAAPGGMGFL